MAKMIQAILSLKDDFSKAINNAKEASKNFGSEWERQGRNIERHAKKLSDLGDELSKNVTSMVASAVTGAGAAFIELDAGMDLVVAKSGAVGKALEANKEVFEELYRSTAFDAESIGNAVGAVQAYADVSGESLEELSETALKFAKITDADIGESVMMAARMMEQFDATASDMPHIFDAMAKSMQDSGVEVEELFDVVQENVPQLKALGMGFEEAFAFAGKIGEAGFQMDRIFDSIKDSQSVLSESGLNLADGLKVVQQELEAASSDTDRLGVALKYFGEENAAYMLQAIDQGVVSLEDFSQAAADSSGTIEETYGAMSGPAEELISLWHELKLTAGDFAEVVIEGAAPILDSLADSLRTVGEWLRGLDDDQKRVVANIVLLVGVAGPLISVLGMLGSGFGKGFTNIMKFGGGCVRVIGNGAKLLSGLKLMSGFMMGPWGVAIDIAVKAGVTLYKNWGKVKSIGVGAFRTVTSWINTAKKAIFGLKDAVWDFIKNSKIGRIGSMVGNAISSVKSYIGKNADGTDYWRGGLTMIHERGGELVDLPRGSRVYPHDKSVQMAYADGQRSSGGVVFSFKGATFVVREEADVERIARAIVRRLSLARKNRVVV